MSKSLIEVYKDKILKVEEQKEDKNIIISGAFCAGDKKNSKGRTYSSDLIKREIEKVQKLIESGESFFSNTGEPALEVKNISHKINEIYYDEEEKQGIVNAELLDTASGRTIKAIIKGGGSLFFGMSGVGETDPQGKVKNDYQLNNVNISIAGDSGSGFNLNNIVGESFSISDKQGLSEEDIQKKFKQAKMANFKGNLESYKNKIAQVRKITNDEWSRFTSARISGYQGNIESYLKIKK